MARKKKHTNIITSIFKNSLVSSSQSKMKVTAEAFNKIAANATINLLKESKFNKRELVKYIESDKGEVYCIKVLINKNSTAGVDLEYTYSDSTGKELFKYNESYDSTTNDSIILKDFAKLLDSILNL